MVKFVVVVVFDDDVFRVFQIMCDNKMESEVKKIPNVSNKNSINNEISKQNIRIWKKKVYLEWESIIVCKCNELLQKCNRSNGFDLEGKCVMIENDLYDENEIANCIKLGNCVKANCSYK